ncbi:MAG: adenylate kinase [Bacilli bacterium]|nr:adenylate kinase [Bacilli bacterium]
MKSVILIAAPAAGKGTEAAYLKEQYNMPHISTGDILREKAQEDSELGRDIDYKINNGIFVSDELIIEILKERIMQEDCNNGYILDGFPRNVAQAEAYQEMLNELGKDLGVVIVLDIDKKLAASRIAGRISCPECKEVYNTSNDDMKPKTEGICDKCGAQLVKRVDDNEETYMGRYNTYIEKTAPLIDFYEKQGVVYHVDSNHGREKTHEQVVKILGE